jgi:hypothetical protein
MNLDDPNNGSLEPNLQLTQKSSKTPLIVVGVLSVGGLGFFVMRSMKQQDERKRHAQLMQQFADLEKDEVGKFWACVLGPNVDAGMFPDNLALSARITAQFGTNAKNYPKTISEDCTPKAIDAMHKVEGLSAPEAYGEPLKKYAASLKDLAGALDAWAKIAPAQVQEMEIAKRMDSDGNAWHTFEGGKPSNEVVVFDHFLHCAVPTVDSMKDGQALVEFLFNSCKKTDYVEKLNSECGKELLNDSPMGPTKAFASTQKKMGADDRDLQAFDDCMRKGRKGKRRDDLADVGKAWVAWQEAGRDVRKIGKDALKD